MLNVPSSTDNELDTTAAAKIVRRDENSRELAESWLVPIEKPPVPEELEVAFPQAHVGRAGLGADGSLAELCHHHTRSTIHSSLLTQIRKDITNHLSAKKSTVSDKKREELPLLGEKHLQIGGRLKSISSHFESPLQLAMKKARK